MSGGKRKVLLRGLYVSPICNKSYFEQDIKVRDHDLHQICNISFELTNKVNVIFHNFRGSNNYLTMHEIGKFIKKISVIPNGREEYLALTTGKYLVFIYSMKFLSSNLDNLIKNLQKDQFEFFFQGFWEKNLK